MKGQKLIPLIIVLILLFDLFLSYGFLMNPYGLYFNRLELSEINYQKRVNYSLIATLINLILVWSSVIWSIRLWRVKKRFALIAPIISILTFWIFMSLQTYYPDMSLEYTENGYRYRIQKWYLDGDKVYKRWKSKEPELQYQNDKDIIWLLDSLSTE